MLNETSNALTTFGEIPGAAWGLGWEFGRLFVNANWYQEFRENTLMPFRKDVFEY